MAHLSRNIFSAVHACSQAISESSKRSKVLIGTSTPNEIEEEAQRLRKKRIVTGRDSKDREKSMHA